MLQLLGELANFHFIKIRIKVIQAVSDNPILAMIDVFYTEVLIAWE